LTTYEISDYVIPILTKKIWDKDNIKKKIARNATKVAEGKEHKLEFIKKFADLFKSDLVCNFSVSVISPVIVATIHGKTSGFKSSLDYLKKISESNQEQEDAEELEFPEDGSDSN